MFASPPVPPRSLGHIDITVSISDSQRIWYPSVVYCDPNPEATTPPSPTQVTEGPQLPLRLTRGILGSTPSTQVNFTHLNKLSLSPNHTPIEVEELSRTLDHTQIYKRYFHVPNL